MSDTKNTTPASSTQPSPQGTPIVKPAQAATGQGQPIVKPTGTPIVKP